MYCQNIKPHIIYVFIFWQQFWSVGHKLASSRNVNVLILKSTRWPHIPLKRIRWSWSKILKRKSDGKGHPAFLILILMFGPSHIWGGGGLWVVFDIFLSIYDCSNYILYSFAFFKCIKLRIYNIWGILIFQQVNMDFN